MAEDVEFGGPRGVTSAYRNLCYSDPRFAALYEGWEEIGQGGYALVVKVKSKTFGRTIALKIITNLSIEAGPRFLREVNVAASVSSKYVVRTYGSFVEGALAWMEMEYLEGTDLGRALARRKRDDDPFPLSEALEIAVASAQGLADAHEAGLIHRDIKPANIFLPKSRMPPAKILDLGIARHGEWEQFTRTDMILGTPEYASPEAALQKPLGPESDVHSLGQVFYELFGNLQKAYPHTTNAQAALGARVKWRTRPLHESNAAVPPALEALVGECLSLKLTGRPTAGEVCERLREIQRSLGSAPASTPRAEALTPAPQSAATAAPSPVLAAPPAVAMPPEPVAAPSPPHPPPPSAPPPVVPARAAEAPAAAAVVATTITPAARPPGAAGPPTSPPAGSSSPAVGVATAILSADLAPVRAAPMPARAAEAPVAAVATTITPATPPPGTRVPAPAPPAPPEAAVATTVPPASSPATSPPQKAAAQPPGSPARARVPAKPTGGRRGQVAAAAGVAALAIVAALFWRSSPAPTSPELPLLTPPPLTSPSAPLPTPTATPVPTPTPVATPTPAPSAPPTAASTAKPGLGSVAVSSSPVTTTLRGRFVRLTVPSNLLGRRVRVTVTGTTGKVFTKVLQADAVSLFVPVDDFSPAPAESESLTSAKSEVLP